MNYEQLAKVNESIKTIDVKGKEYAEVNQRIKAFRMLYPDGAITTSIASLENGVCVMQATVFADDGRILAMGTAYEKEGSSFINKTSYIENCETSAVGRALGMLGIGIDTSVASAEEVQNAMLNQDEKIDYKKSCRNYVETLVKLTGKTDKEIYAEAKKRANSEDLGVICNVLVKMLKEASK